MAPFLHELSGSISAGTGTTSDAQELYDPRHPAVVIWRLPGLAPRRPVTGSMGHRVSAITLFGSGDDHVTALRRQSVFVP